MIFAHMIIWATFATGAPEPTLDTLVRDHEANLRRIHSIKGVLESLLSVDRGKTWTKNRTTYIARSGEKEHTFVQNYIVNNGTKVENATSFEDILATPDGLWTMAGSKADQIPQRAMTMLDRAIGTKVSGLIRPPEPCEAYGHRFNTWGTEVMLLPDQEYSLEELCQKNPGVRAVERTDKKGGLLWELALKAPEKTYVISISPSHGCLIAKAEVTIPAGKFTFTVDEYQECERGVFLPKKVRFDDSFGSKKFLVETTLKDVEVNVPIDDKEFQIRYPEGIGVSNLVENVHYVWGKGKPAKTFDTLDDFNRWKKTETARLMSELQGGQSSWTEWILLGVVLLVLVGLIGARTYLRRSHAKPSGSAA
jgi:hypothetical protein